MLARYFRLHNYYFCLIVSYIPSIIVMPAFRTFALYLIVITVNHDLVERQTFRYHQQIAIATRTARTRSATLLASPLFKRISDA